MARTSAGGAGGGVDGAAAEVRRRDLAELKLGPTSGCGLPSLPAARCRLLLVDHPKHLADLHVVAVLVDDARQDAGGVGVDLEIDLVGLELDQRLAGGDRLALSLQPARHARFDDRFPQLRNDDVHEFI